MNIFFFDRKRKRMYRKIDFLFFYFLSLVKEHIQTMNHIKRYLRMRKHVVFEIFDALILYYYIVIGLQAEAGFRFIELYLKKHNTSPFFLVPLLKN